MGEVVGALVGGFLGGIAGQWLDDGFAVHGRAGFTVVIGSVVLFSLIGSGLAKDLRKP